MVLCVTTFQVALAQIKAKVINEQGEELPSATIALLDPVDSTVVAFTLSNESGNFEFKHLSKEDYLLQINLFNYQTWYRSVKVSDQEIDLGLIVLKTLQELGEVQIKAEPIPLTFNGDTLTYNAASFKTNPDASTEDLLKKLPGIQVDQAGNIKAQGENVQKIMVDGKEVFSNDPKVISKNLPADAVKKVQVFEEKSAEEELGQFKDSNKDKTINIVLKDDKKNLWFGTLSAGYGTNNRFQGVAKAFHFGTEKQLAILSNFNNINQFGFSFQDYIDYNGGLQSMSNGNVSIQLDENDFPIDFGKPIYGNITSGVSGLNFSKSREKGKVFNLTYLGTGQQKQLLESSYLENYTGSSTFLKHQIQDELNKAQSHKLNWSYKNKQEGKSQFSVGGAFSYNRGNNHQEYESTDSLRTFDTVQRTNGFEQDYRNYNQKGKAKIDLNYTRKISDKKPFELYRLNLENQFDLQDEQLLWNNLSSFYWNNSTFEDRQQRNNTRYHYVSSAEMSLLGRINEKNLLELSARPRFEGFDLNRVQYQQLGLETRIDSLSPHFLHQYSNVVTGLSYRRNGEKFHLDVDALVEIGRLSTGMRNGEATQQRTFFYAVPRFMIEYNIRKGHNLRLMGGSSVQQASTEQLLPTLSNINRLQYVYGNQNLLPEYRHNLGLHWMLFDEFSFISLFSNFEAVFTQDKITFSREILPDFSQKLTYVNVSSDYVLRAHFEFSAPVRKLKLNTHLELDQAWNRGLSPVNGIENQLENYTQHYLFSLDNRKKNKVDLSLGVDLSITKSYFSLQSELNSTYTETALFSSFTWHIGKKWHYELSSRINQYHSTVNDFDQLVPLLKTKISCSMLKNNRGTIAVDVFDILNQNKGIQQLASMNSLQQSRSNMLGRYVLVSFSYKLNKAK